MDHVSQLPVKWLADVDIWLTKKAELQAWAEASAPEDWKQLCHKVVRTYGLRSKKRTFCWANIGCFWIISTVA